MYREAIPVATLTVRTGVEIGRIYAVVGGVTTIGRGSMVDIRLRDDAVSRRHCQIVWDQPTYIVEDLGSKNGTYLNGDRVHAAFLTNRDRLGIGDHVLEFTFIAVGLGRPAP
jgi:two-component system, cell cycle response regulator